MTAIKLKLLLGFIAFFVGLVSPVEEDLPTIGDASSSVISVASEYNLGRLYIAQLRRNLPEYWSNYSRLCGTPGLSLIRIQSTYR